MIKKFKMESSIQLINQLHYCNNFKEIENYLEKYPESDWQYIIENIPDFLKKGMNLYKSKSEKNIYLHSALVSYGALMIYVKGKYADRIQYPMIYLAVVGSAASNKSIINVSNAILHDINEVFLKQSEYLQKKYLVEHNKWKKLIKSDPVLEEPHRPPYCTVCIASDITKSKFIVQLSDNRYVPSIIISDEIDTLNTAMKSEHGNGLSSVLRTAYHHDTISQQLKSDNQHFRIESPKLGMILGGTKNQMINFIGGISNGLFSRFTMIEIDDGPKWKNIAPCRNCDDKNAVLGELSQIAVKIFDYLATNNFEMLLAENQWRILNEFGSNNLGKYSNLHNENLGSVVKRHSLMAFRFAMILTGLKYWTNKSKEFKVVCTDEDFFIAFLLMRRSFSHSVSFFKKFNDGFKTNEAKKYEAFLNELPQFFSRGQAIEAGKKMKMSNRSIDRMLKILTDGKQINKQSFGNYLITPLAKLQNDD